MFQYNSEKLNYANFLYIKVILRSLKKLLLLLLMAIIRIGFLYSLSYKIE